MRSISLTKKINLFGWLFVLPASLMIFVFNFYPMVQAFLLSLQTGVGNNLKFGGLGNYRRLFIDDMFLMSVRNVMTFLAFQVPIMLFLALVLASILNGKNLRFKAMFRVMLFLPCATALVSSGMIFRSLFSVDGFVNSMLIRLGLFHEPFAWLTDAFWQKVVIILVITWRWTGYNMIFYLAGLQNIDTSIYEAARIDGASSVTQFFLITLPLLKPVILLTTIMSTNGTLQLFDEVRIMTGGNLSLDTLTISQYIYNLSFWYTPRFGYAATVSYSIFIMVALLSFIQMKVGDKR